MMLGIKKDIETINQKILIKIKTSIVIINQVLAMVEEITKEPLIKIKEIIAKITAAIILVDLIAIKIIKQIMYKK